MNACHRKLSLNKKNFYFCRFFPTISSFSSLFSWRQQRPRPAMHRLRGVPVVPAPRSGIKKITKLVTGYSCSHILLYVIKTGWPDWAIFFGHAYFFFFFFYGPQDAGPSPWIPSWGRRTTVLWSLVYYYWCPLFPSLLIVDKNGLATIWANFLINSSSHPGSKTFRFL
jgi:hypothetical protein